MIYLDSDDVLSQVSGEYDQKRKSLITIFTNNKTRNLETTQSCISATARLLLRTNTTVANEKNGAFAS